jgi:hypothetical protein
MQNYLLMKIARSINNKSKYQRIQPNHKKIDKKKNLKNPGKITNNAGQKTNPINNE